MRSICVLDYDIGNVRSVVKALEFLGVRVVLTDSKKEIMSSMGLIVPGVSSFGACVEKLKEKGLFEFLQKYIESGKKYLGICLGYQLLFESSEESPGIEGLCIFKGTVKRFGSGIKVPHIGWNTVQPVTGKTMFKDVNSLYYYFVHSYYVEPNNKDIVSGYTDYGINFASSIEYQNIWACQFHPEKSSASGLQLLRNFVRWCEADD